MTMPSFPDAPPLLTDADVLRRVEALIGPASSPRTLWLLPVDGDDRQTPVVTPIDDVPRRPDDMVDGLGTVLAGIAPDLATAGGSGSVIFVLERLGSDHVSADDREWAEVLEVTCTRIGVGLRGVYLSTRAGVRHLR